MTDKRSLGRTNVVVFASWSEEKRTLFWDAQSPKHHIYNNFHEPIPFSACHIWTGSHQNGYPAVSQGHGQSKIKMHILAAWLKYRRIPAANEVVSHLCHRKSCINPDHLVIETIAANNSRKGCLRAHITKDGATYNLCWHKTQCLRADTDTITDFVPEIHLSSGQCTHPFPHVTADSRYLSHIEINSIHPFPSKKTGRCE